jgi:hypothetical protein
MSDPLVDGVVRSQKDSSWPDINRATGDDIARMLMGIVSDMPAARAKLARAMAFVNERHRVGMMEVRRSLGCRPTERQDSPTGCTDRPPSPPGRPAKLRPG